MARPLVPEPMLWSEPVVPPVLPPVLPEVPAPLPAVPPVVCAIVAVPSRPAAIAAIIILERIEILLS